MKKQVRRNVFETNSSSMHSLSISRQGITEHPYMPLMGNKVIVYTDEFSWGYDEYNDPEMKLSYLITMLYCLNGFDVRAVYETEEFQKINEIVSKRCGCEGIFISDKFEGYVDHQSLDDIDEMMKEYGCTIEEFIFDEGITLIIDNDNR